MLQAQPWWSVPDWWAAIGTIAAVVVAIFGESIRAYYRRPKLSVSINVAPPDCHKTQLTSETGEVVADCYYFRLRVKNNGKRRVEDAEVYVAELYRETEAGHWSAIADFPPMDLLWSHVRRPFQSISPGVARHCDFGLVVFEKLRGTDRTRDNFRAQAARAAGDGFKFVLDLEVKPNAGTYQLSTGTYKVKVIVAAGNAKAHEHTFQVINSGRWFQDEAEMFEKGVRIKQLS